MSYYRRGKTNLQDETYRSMLKTLEEEVSKLPPEKQVEKAQKVLNNFSKELPDIIEKMKTEIIAQSRKDVKKAINFDEKQRRRFEKRLQGKYGELLDKYMELMGVCLEAVQSHRESVHEALGEKDTVLPVILRLHARAYRIGNEILALVRSGYGTGALARWRAMHEVVVVMAYLRDEGPKAIKVYQDHGVVSQYKAMKAFQDHCQRLGEEPLTTYEVRLAKRKYDRRLAKYGNNFKNDYGWAWHLSGHTINNFADLEQHVGIDHLRPYYKLASLSIHSEWRSYLTGEEYEALQDPGVVLVGPADYGFDDAISLALVTVSHATVLILTYNYAIKSLVYAKVIQQIERDAQDVLEQVIAERKAKKS